MFDFYKSDVGCRMSDVGCRMSDVGCRMSDVGCRIFKVGCRMAPISFRTNDLLSIKLERQQQQNFIDYKYK